MSEAVRSRLGHLLADPGGGVRGIAVLACAPGERHELGLMMAAIALRRDGWKVVYLGADTPLADAGRARASGCRPGCSGSASRCASMRRRSRRLKAFAGGHRSSSSAAPARRPRSRDGSAALTPGRGLPRRGRDRCACLRRSL